MRDTTEEAPPFEKPLFNPPMKPPVLTDSWSLFDTCCINLMFSWFDAKIDLVIVALHERKDREDGVVGRARDRNRKLVSLIVVELDECRERERC